MAIVADGDAVAKNDPQGYGSALTYARRYGLATLVGLVSEADDDAEAAVPRSARENKPAKRPSPPRSDPAREAIDGLPNLDGVTYRTVTAQDGTPCITATGNTQPKKTFLREAGFRWMRGVNCGGATPTNRPPEPPHPYLTLFHPTPAFPSRVFCCLQIMCTAVRK